MCSARVQEYTRVSGALVCVQEYTRASDALLADKTETWARAPAHGRQAKSSSSAAHRAPIARLKVSENGTNRTRAADYTYRTV